ncbi:MAG: flavodoxin [Lachnospiraceae bacterium]|nr:flavodoxin [Lachnospiraceae bacterium]
MKTLVVYFSLEGNTEYVANRIKEKTGSDLLKLIPKKAYHDKGFAKFFWGGKSAVMAEKPELEPYDVHLSEYDRIIFGFPVWASNFTPPIRTFVEDNRSGLNGKKVAAFACQSGSGAEKALVKLAKTIGIDSFEQKAVFIDPKAKRGADTDAKIETFCEKLNA